MSAEIALLNNINNKAGYVSNLTIEAATDIPKYSSVAINNEGKGELSPYEYQATNLIDVTYGTEFDLQYSGIGYTVGGGKVWQKDIPLGDDHFFTICAYSVAVGVNNIVGLIYKIDTTTGTSTVISRSGTFQTAGNFNTTETFEEQNKWTWCKVGDTFVCMVYTNNGSTPYERLFEIAYNSTNKTLGTVVRKWNLANTDHEYSFVMSTGSDTHYLHGYRTSPSYYLGIKALETTSYSAFVSSQNSSSYSFISNWVSNYLYNYYCFVANNMLICIYSHYIYYMSLGGGTTIPTTDNNISAPSYPSGYPTMVGTFNETKLFHVSDVDENDYFHVVMLDKTRMITYKFQIISTAIAAIDSYTFDCDTRFALRNASYSTFAQLGYKTPASQDTLIGAFTTNIWSDNSDSMTNHYRPLIYKLFYNGTFYELSVIDVPDSFPIQNTIGVRVCGGAYDATSGNVFLCYRKVDIPDTSSVDYNNIATLEIDGTTAADLQYARETYLYALEDITSGTTGSVISTKPVITDTTVVAGTEYLDRFIATTTNKLVEVK